MVKYIAILTVFFLSACASTTKIHGSLIKPADIDMLRVGVNTQTDVLRVLGTPSTKSTLNAETWYYITDIKEYKPLAKPTLKERRVVGLAFTKDGILDRVFDKDEFEARQIMPDSETTNKNKRGFFAEIYYNITSRMIGR